MAIGILIKQSTIGWEVRCLSCDKSVASVYTNELTDAKELDYIAEKHLAVVHGDPK